MKKLEVSEAKEKRVYEDKKVFISASKFKPRLSNDGKFLYLNLNGAFVALNLAYLAAIIANANKAVK